MTAPPKLHRRARNTSTAAPQSLADCIAHVLRRAREQRGFGLTAAAAAAHVDPSTLSRWETFGASLVPAVQLCALARLYGRTGADLMREAELYSSRLVPPAS